MITCLKTTGYSILEQHQGHEHGTDIIAEKNGNKLCLELKGESKAYDVDFGTLVYQIMKKIKAMSNDECAKEISKDYEKYVMQCNFSLQKLKIKVFVITDSEVKQLI